MQERRTLAFVSALGAETDAVANWKQIQTQSLTRTSHTANVKMLNNQHKNLQAQANT